MWIKNKIVDKYIYVVADTNDADYISKLRKITEEEYQLILPVIQAIKDFKPYKAIEERYNSSWHHHHNYPTSDCCRDDLGEKSVEELYGHLDGFELFDYEFRPNDEYGIHTIETVEIFEVTNVETLI